MKINLRKANAIQAEIRRAINGCTADANVGVTEFTPNVEEVIREAGVKYQLANQRKIALTNALYNIRGHVANANAAAGVNILLTDIQRIEAVMSIHSVVTVQQVAKSIEEVNARVEKQKSLNGESRLSMLERYNTVDTTVVTQADIENAKEAVKTLKRQRQELQDKLLTLNVTVTIDISPEDEQLLVEEGIL